MNDTTALSSGAGPAVSEFDFRRQDVAGGTDLGEFLAGQAAFAKNLSSELSEYLGTPFKIELQKIRQLSWQDFQKELESPTCLLVLDLKPLVGYGVLELGSQFVLSVLEILLGATPEGRAQNQREPTAIEKKLLDGMFKLVVKRLSESWSSDRAKPSLDSVVYQAAAANQISAQEAMAIAELQVDIEGRSGVIRSAFPVGLVKPARQTSGTEPVNKPIPRSIHDERRLLERISPGKVRAQISLSSATMKLSDLAGLEPGDVLDLRYPVDAPLTLSVNGVEKFEGFVVPANNKRSFAIRGVPRAGSK